MDEKEYIEIIGNIRPEHGAICFVPDHLVEYFKLAYEQYGFKVLPMSEMLLPQDGEETL